MDELKNLEDGSRVFVSNAVGCESTELEGLRVLQYLALNGHTITESPREADFIIVNTCAFLQFHRKAIVDRLNTFTKEAPEAQILIMGCIGGIAPEIIDPYHVRLVCGHSDLQKLDSIFLRFVAFNQTPPYSWSKNLNRMLISIGRGCIYNCSFCSIKKSIGFIKSRSVKDIIADFRGNLTAGNTRFLLAGDDLGSYGKDIHSNLPELLGAIDGIEADFSVLLSNIHPAGFLKYFEAISAFLASPHASQWLFLPVQSGNQNVLSSMKRPYSINELSRKLKELGDRVAGIRLYFDIMVGYPTETEEAFNDTLGFIMRHPPSCLMSAPFSHERDTEAARLQPLEDSVVKERVRWLRMMHQVAIQRSNGVPVANWGDD